MIIREMRHHHQRQGGPSNEHRHQEAEHVCRVMAGKCVPGSYGLVSGDSKNGHPKVGGKRRGPIQALLGRLNILHLPRRHD